MFSKDVVDRLMILGQVVQNPRQIAAKNLILGNQRLAIGVSGGRHGSVRTAVLAHEADAIHWLQTGSHGFFHTRNLPHDRDTGCTNIDVLAIGPELGESLDDGDFGTGFGEPVCCRWACNGSTHN